MSRSQPALTNPAEHYFTWSGSEGRLTWWDKENSKEVQVKIPFEFLVLDECATITGFCEQDGSRYWSNEVRSVSREEFTVKTAKGVKQTGLYKDLADVRSKGAKYAKSIYIAHRGPNGDFIIGNLKASGAALTAWIELSQKHQVGNGKILLVGSTEATKGATKYQIPTFEWVHSLPEEDAEAIKLDQTLQVYLKQYFTAASQPAETIPSDVDPTVGLASNEQIANYVKPSRSIDPLDQAKDAAAVESYQRNADIEDTPINLDDIPF